jgi:thiamine-monophosphate kinase
MQIKDLGELGVIDILARMAVDLRAGPSNAEAFSFDLAVDNGDDTAVWNPGRGKTLFTTDTMVEGVHFTRQTTPWRDLGWKSLASNISDVASMGGLPAYALVTLGLPPETEVADLQILYEGMLEISNEYKMAIIGGDMVRSPVVFITVALTGVMQGQPMVRTGAQPGDLVAVTGHLGSSGGGLKLMLAGDTQPGDTQEGQAADYLRESHRRPRPAVAVGQSLVDSEVLTAMDVSDGLADDFSKLCRASGVSGTIFVDRLPIHPLLSSQFPDDYLDLALGGGEDYVLLFTGPSAKVNHVVSTLPAGAAVVGVIKAGEPGKITVVDAQGKAIPATSRGWDHFGPKT